MKKLNNWGISTSPKLGAAYKWDTPDKPAVTNGNSQTVQETITLVNPYTNQTLIIPKPEQQYFKAAPDPTYGQELQQSRIPIVRTAGDVLNYFGY